jgi:ADP-ribose pyrophosphatase YjhB (NUDIX family)
MSIATSYIAHGCFVIPEKDGVYMIVLDTEQRYRYMVAGIAIHSEHVLLQQNGDTWMPPGGYIEAHQPARAALKQIVHDTLGADIYVGQVMWVVERIFDHLDKPAYDFILYFYMSFPSALLCFPRNTPITWHHQGIPVTYQWIPLDKLDDIKIFPTSLRRAIHQSSRKFECMSNGSRTEPGERARKAYA